MKIIPIQKAYARKFERQRRIAELEYHAAGHCVHLGKLSPGCYSCFVPNKYRENLHSGARCNLNCVYCVRNKSDREQEKIHRLRLKAKFLGVSRRPDYDPQAISFTGGGEPLLYMEVIAGWMDFFQEIEWDTGKRPWYYLYTNGLLADEETLKRLQDMGFDEIRFHLGASSFAKKVYKNLEKAVRYLRVVSVETPAWPPHRKKLFAMLPIINDLGVKHLNLGEVEITPFNYNRIAEVIPNAELYHCHEMHLYDWGLTYDLMEEVVIRKYSFSVLDCSCFVKCYQRAPAKYVAHEEPVGLIAKY
jgi:uncharacterized protein